MSLVVDFAGLPGSGKSALYSELLRRFAERNVDGDSTRLSGTAIARVAIGNRAHRALRNLRTAFEHRGALRVAAGPLSKSRRPLAEKLQAARLLLVALDNDRLARACTDADVCLLDEGLLQRAFLLFVGADRVAPSDVVQAFLASVPRADVTIVLDVAPHLSLARLANRERGLPPRLARLSHRDQVDRLTEAQEMLLTAARETTLLGSTTALVLDASLTLDALADQAEAAIGTAANLLTTRRDAR